MKLRKHALLWVALLGPTAELGAQDVLAPGARLRLTAPAIAKQRMVGRLIAEEADSLRLEVGTGVITLPRESVTKIEISHARSRKTHGARLGLLVGAVAGAALGYAMGEDQKDAAPFCTLGGCATLGPLWLDKPASAAAVGIFFGAVGAGAGALMSPGEKWEPIPPGRVRLSLAPAPGRGVAAQLTIGFGGKAR